MLDSSLQQTQKGPRGPLIISELKVGSSVHGWLLVVSLHERIASNRKPFLDLKLRDPRGNELVARQFDPPLMNGLAPQEGKVALIEGSVEEYRNQLQIKLLRVELDESAPIDLFVLGTRRPIAQLEVDFHRLMAGIEHASLYELLHCCCTTSRSRRGRSA